MLTVLPRTTLALHPLAAPVFDAYAAPGDLGLRGGPIRAVRPEEGTVLAFTGFARLRGAPEERIELRLEDVLTPAQIVAAAWEEVEDVMRLLALPPRVREGFVRAVAQNAAPAQLAAWSLASPARAAAGLARRLHAPLREEPAPGRMIDAILTSRRAGSHER